MIAQLINKRISFTILGICMLNIVGFSAYIFCCFSEEWDNIIYWIRNDLYILSLLALFYFIIADKVIKISLLVSFFVYLSYILAVIVDNITNNGINKEMWWLLNWVSFVVILTSGIYVARRSK